MFRCRSCLVDCLRAIIGETPHISSPALIRSRRTIAKASTRAYSTAVARPNEYAGFQREQGLYSRQEFKPFDKPTRTANIVSRNLRNQLDEPLTTKREKELWLELKYLQDPLKLADSILHTLRGNDLSKALGLVRLASKNMECTVSWNHIIDWLMARRDTKSAFKLYNEMKKRAQFPDSHTVILLLRGLSNPPMHSTDVGQALSLYHSLDAPNSKVQRSIMHTNAAMKVCARAYDMESMWGVASRIPDHGPGSADNLTFTTILNAIRENAMLNSGFKGGEDNLKEKAVLDGKRIWEDVVGKWRSGNLVVDEALVCAMGRLLLIGTSPSDWDDVLSLIEQTMDVPRLAPRLGTETRTGEHIPNIREKPMDNDEDSEDKDANDQLAMPSGGQFDIVKSRKKRSHSGIFAKPGKNTLSVILDSCLKMMSPKVANEYWNLLTDIHKLEPDLDNYNMYLRILRQSRASARTVEVLRPLVSTSASAPALQPIKKTFRIAMSTCGRDKKNHNVMTHASTILDFMDKSLEDADPKVLTMYLDLALSTQKANHIVEAFQRMTPHVSNMKSWLTYGATGQQVTELDKEDALALIKTMVGTIDQLINKAMVPREDYAVWSQRRSKLAAFLTRRNKFASNQRSQEQKALSAPPTDRVTPQSDMGEREDENASGSTELQTTKADALTVLDPSQQPKPWKKPVHANPRRLAQLKSEVHELTRRTQFRRESRQLRHFRRNERVREKRAVVDGAAPDSPQISGPGEKKKTSWMDSPGDFV